MTNDTTRQNDADAKITEQPTETPVSAEETEISLSELDSFLYECADIIRNRVDKTDYKEYILPLFFYKTFHDTYNDNYNRVLEEKREEGVPEQAAVSIAHDEAYHEVTIPREFMWDDLITADNPALAGRRSGGFRS